MTAPGERVEPARPDGGRRAGIALTVGCVALLVLYPWAWVAPIAEAGLSSWFGGQEITILTTIRALWQEDAALAVLVAALAILLPYAKAVVLTAVSLGWRAHRLARAVDWVGRFAMADVFLLAFYVAAAKGVGLGYLTVAWGVWLFTFCVLGSIALGALLGRHVAAGR